MLEKLGDVALLTLSTLSSTTTLPPVGDITYDVHDQYSCFFFFLCDPGASCLGFILFAFDCKQFLASHHALSETLPHFVMANVDGAFS